mmetsp:Transcript_87701/g.237773  ORF Transcript_87701/g.237773 Transcript_87701/m.237773 type:complete len:229 (+) Transcript_87701:351-1037(+)
MGALPPLALQQQCSACVQRPAPEVREFRWRARGGTERPRLDPRLRVRFTPAPHLRRGPRLGGPRRQWRARARGPASEAPSDRIPVPPTRSGRQQDDPSELADAGFRIGPRGGDPVAECHSRVHRGAGDDPERGVFLLHHGDVARKWALGLRFHEHQHLADRGTPWDRLGRLGRDCHGSGQHLHIVQHGWPGADGALRVRRGGHADIPRLAASLEAHDSDPAPCDDRIC